LFGIFVGGITGVMVAAVPFDIHVHDILWLTSTTFCSAVVLGIYAAIFHLVPKLPGGC